MPSCVPVKLHADKKFNGGVLKGEGDERLLQAAKGGANSGESACDDAEHSPEKETHRTCVRDAGERCKRQRPEHEDIGERTERRDGESGGWVIVPRHAARACSSYYFGTFLVENGPKDCHLLDDNPVGETGYFCMRT